jgi:hypothetical protein
MKFACVLLSAQTALLILLFIKVGSFEARLVHSAQPLEQPVSQKPLTMTSPPDLQVVEKTGLTSNQVRSIIREELHAMSATWEGTGADPMPENDSPVFDDSEMQYRSELIAEQLELLKAQSEVSSGEIDSLISEIAQLDPERRTAMMKILNGAINRGEIKSHL